MFFPMLFASKLWFPEKMHRNATKINETHFWGHWNIVCVWEPGTNLDVFWPTSTCHQTAKFTKKYLGVSTRSNMDMK